MFRGNSQWFAAKQLRSKRGEHPKMKPRYRPSLQSPEEETKYLCTCSDFWCSWPLDVFRGCILQHVSKAYHCKVGDKHCVNFRTKKLYCDFRSFLPPLLPQQPFLPTTFFSSTIHTQSKIIIPPARLHLSQGPIQSPQGPPNPLTQKADIPAPSNAKISWVDHPGPSLQTQQKRT